MWIWDWLKSTVKVIKETITRKSEIRTIDETTTIDYEEMVRLDSYEERMEIDREYIPYGSVAYKDYKTGRFRDTKTGKFISLEQYKEIKSEIAEYNLRQLLSSSKYDYTQEEIDDILQRYYEAVDLDRDEAVRIIETAVMDYR